MKQENQVIKIALTDDHVLLRNTLATLVNSFQNCSVILEANNGKDLINQLKKDNLPDLILLDLNMPCMDGFETAEWLRNNFPEIKILILSMRDGDLLFLRLLQFGVNGFLKKNIEPSELHLAIRTVIQSGYYYSEYISGKIASSFRNGNLMVLERAMLTAKEITFLKLAASELTYKEIAQEMYLNPRAVDNLRDNLFQKLEVKSRVALAMYAIRHGVVAFEN